MTIVVPADPLEQVIDELFDLLQRLDETADDGWSCGTHIPAGQSPSRFVMVRDAGGSSTQHIATRQRVDVLVWGGPDGDEYTRRRVARILQGSLQRSFRCRVFMTATDMPDPADGAIEITMFTIELLLRGVQSG